MVAINSRTSFVTYAFLHNFSRVETTTLYILYEWIACKNSQRTIGVRIEMYDLSHEIILKNCLNVTGRWPYKAVSQQDKLCFGRIWPYHEWSLFTWSNPDRNKELLFCNLSFILIRRNISTHCEVNWESKDVGWWSAWYRSSSMDRIKILNCVHKRYRMEAK